MRVNFTNAVIREIASRATDMKGNTYCEQCSAFCASRADYQIDHIVAEGVKPNDALRRLTADDGKLLCLTCHERKTKRDMFEIGKANRLRKQNRVDCAGPTALARRYGIVQRGPK